MQMSLGRRGSTLFFHRAECSTAFLVWQPGVEVIMGALAALAARVAAGLGARAGPLTRLLPTVGAGFAGVGLGEAAFGGDNGQRRRRRRKALTNDDVRTALTIASAISKKAAENFILMRVRGQ